MLSFKKLLFGNCLFLLLACNTNPKSTVEANEPDNTYAKLEQLVGSHVLSVDTAIYYISPEFASVDSDESYDINNISVANSALQKEFYIEMSKCEPRTILITHSEKGDVYIEQGPNQQLVILNDISIYVPQKQFDSVFKVLESQL